jgi:hypothetical protein
LLDGVLPERPVATTLDLLDTCSDDLAVPKEDPGAEGSAALTTPKEKPEVGVSVVLAMLPKENPWTEGSFDFAEPNENV